MITITVIIIIIIISIGLPTDYAWVWYSVLILFGEYIFFLIISIYAFDKIRFQVVSLPNEIDDEIDDHHHDDDDDHTLLKNNKTTTTTTDVSTNNDKTKVIPINLKERLSNSLDNYDHINENQSDEYDQQQVINPHQHHHNIINNDDDDIISRKNIHTFIPIPTLSPDIDDDNDKVSINQTILDTNVNTKIDSSNVIQNLSTINPSSDSNMTFEPISFAFQDIWYKVKLATGKYKYYDDDNNDDYDKTYDNIIVILSYNKQILALFLHNKQIVSRRSIEYKIERTDFGFGTRRQ